MNLFKKKVVKRETISSELKKVGLMTIEDLPTSAIEFTYEELQKKYQEYPDQGVQQKLVYLSKILTDRATNTGITSLAKEASSFFPAVSQEMIDNMPENEQKKLQELVNDMKNMKQSITNLSLKDNVEVRTDDEVFNTDLQKEIEEEQKRKQKKIEQVYEEAVPKPKLSFFKKIKQESIKYDKYDNTIPAPSLDIQKQLLKTLEVEQNPLKIQKELRIKENAKKLREATERSINVLRKKKEEKSEKPSFKNMEDIYCSNCKHQLKSHQNGCSKCGCLVTIDEIAEAHGVQLYKPKEVLEKIEEEYQLPVTEVHESDMIDEPEIQQIIQKQASQLASMVQTKQFQSLKEIPKKNNTIHNPEHQVVGDINCTCDHEKSHHYYNGVKYEFCTNNACLCSEFKPYPS